MCIVSGWLAGSVRAFDSVSLRQKQKKKKGKKLYYNIFGRFILLIYFSGNMPANMLSCERCMPPRILLCMCNCLKTWPIIIIILERNMIRV